MFRGPRTRRLTAEQFVDTLSLLGVSAGSPESPARPPARAWLYDNDALMAALSRPSRDAIVTARDDSPHTLQALELISGSSLDRRIRDTAAKLLANSDGLSRDELIDRIHLLMLSRRPTDDERRVAERVIGPDRTEEQLADWIWILLALPEFQWLQ